MSIKGKSSIYVKTFLSSSNIQDVFWKETIFVMLYFGVKYLPQTCVNVKYIPNKTKVICADLLDFVCD